MAIIAVVFLPGMLRADPIAGGTSTVPSPTSLIIAAPIVPAPLPTTGSEMPAPRHIKKAAADFNASKIQGDGVLLPVYRLNNTATGGGSSPPASPLSEVPRPAMANGATAPDVTPAALSTGMPNGASNTIPGSPGAPETTTSGNGPAPAIPASVPTPIPRKIEIAVPTTPQSEPQSQLGQLTISLNKTESIDLPEDVRDVIVGNPEIADVVVQAERQVFVMGKTVGDTNVFLVGAHNKLIRNINISVQPDADGVQQSITRLLPGEMIQASGMGNSIVLTGNASSDGVVAQARDIARRYVAKDENIVNMIRVKNEQQVLLRVRVAEAQKSVLKELGVDNILSPTTLGPLVISGATSALGLGPDIAGSLGLSIGNWDAHIRLLEEQGLIHSLAEPNLLAVSGEVASMLAGGEYPIPVSEGDNGIGIEYKPFGVSLSFLPVVIDGGRINLRVSTEVSALSDTNKITIPTLDGGVDIKSFITRRANSVVELPSGGSLMIAGLMQNNIISGIDGVPGLMNIPILGALFHSTSFQRNETELVILVQAVLSHPVDPSQLALPTDGFAASSDLDRYFLGHLQNIYARKPNPDPNMPQHVQGSLGYVIQ